MANKQTIKDDEFYVKKNDIDAMRRRPTMYVGGVGEVATEHLVHELVDNNRDECIKKDSPGNMIKTVITDTEVTSEDNGRGIPTNILQILLETNQAGSNMTRSGGSTAGENGSGITCITALSSYMEVTTFRPTEKKKMTLIYKEGEKVDEIVEEYHDKRSGLKTTFRPSKKILKTNKFPVEKIRVWLQDFNYTLPRGINMIYTINGVEDHVKHKELWEFFADETHDVVIPQDARMCNDLSINCEGNFVEELVNEHEEVIDSVTRHFTLEAVLTYADPDKYKGEDIRHSWANMIYNRENGEHVNGVLRAFNKVMKKKLVNKYKKLEGINLKRDIENHLSLAVKVFCDSPNLFSAQAKQEVISEELGKAIEETVIKKLEGMTGGAIAEMVEVIHGNYRARIEGEKMRNVAKDAKGFKTWVKPDSYYPCSSVKTEQGKEIFLVEGNSAGGGLKAARNAKYQAILTFRGKSKNTWDCTLEEALKSEPWLNLLKVLECGVGPSFDMRKLAFDKIIIATDADIDGYHIRVGFTSFFIKFLPEIVLAGKLYIAEPPLYRLVAGKDVYFVASQAEYIDACVNSIGKIQVNLPDVKKTINAGDLVSDAFDYLANLTDVSITRSTSPQLLEFIAEGFMKYGNTVEGFEKNIDKWLRNLPKSYRDETKYDSKIHQLKTVIDLHDHLVIIDDDLIEQLQYNINVLRKYGLIIEYPEKGSGKIKSNTLSRFFEDVERFYPTIKDRYKGLGSSPAYASREVIMDPKTRRLLRVSMDNPNVNTIMGNLVGSGKENISARKEMLMDFKVTKDMIDN